jgi:hypothetical protein
MVTASRSTFSSRHAPARRAGPGKRERWGLEEAGPAGARGEAGPPGELPDGGVGIPVSCLSPCHGFDGVVAQYQTSVHYIEYLANLTSTTPETAWTTPGLPCGNCHAIDALEQRAAGNVGTVDGGVVANLGTGELEYRDPAGGALESASYNGSATVAEVYCTTCHAVTNANDPHSTGKPWTPGSFPLLVSPDGGAVNVEKSPSTATVTGSDAGDFGPGNTCMWCHRSRVDITNFLTPTGTCHGSGSVSYPSRDLCFSPQDAKSAGAHAAHVEPSEARTAGVPCSTCHPVPGKNIISGLHGNGIVEVIFDKNAIGPEASYDSATGQCSVTCHDFGGLRPTPTWSQTTPMGCNDCHRSPPPAHYSGRARIATRRPTRTARRSRGGRCTSTDAWSSGTAIELAGPATVPAAALGRVRPPIPPTRNPASVSRSLAPRAMSCRPRSTHRAT